MPDVPTIAEAVLPGFELTSWGGALAPRGTPDAVVEKLSAAIVKVAGLVSPRTTITPCTKMRIMLTDTPVD
jgi:tripartite-type tricarboxylate transporter receptor subunit TctC